MNRARALVAALCEAELGTGTDAHNFVMAAQELLENLAKYAAPGHASFRFELSAQNGRRRARLATRNEASAEPLAVASGLLGRITESRDPVALYDALVAESGESGRSRLGLIRIRAEGDLELEYAVRGSSLEIVVSGDVHSKRHSA
ncbi:MAG TPA: hypothetical protein VMI54_19490 [Polyangiaceae bacterium]|nr:hypothetical protein [Polyangiaceae bacterium]